MSAPRETDEQFVARMRTSGPLRSYEQTVADAQRATDLAMRGQLPQDAKDALDEKQGIPKHVCWDNPVPYESDGALGHGWECGVCGLFLQAG